MRNRAAPEKIPNRILQATVALWLAGLLVMNATPRVIKEPMSLIRSGDASGAYDTGEEITFLIPYSLSADIYISRTGNSRKYVLKDDKDRTPYTIRRYPVSATVTSWQVMDQITSAFTKDRETLKTFENGTAFIKRYDIQGLTIYMLAEKGGRTLYVIEADKTIPEDDARMLYGFITDMTGLEYYGWDIAEKLTADP